MLIYAKGNGNAVKNAVVLARGQFRTRHAKTAHGLILHGRRFRVIAVIDETCAGKDAGELMGIGNRSIPVVRSLGPLLADGKRRPEVLIIGVAPTGGRLPPAWKRDIRKAIEGGLDIVSGLHDFISEQPELAALAKKHRVRIVDVRRPPEKLGLAGYWRSPVPVVLTCGTDCNVGKRTVTIELTRAARARGIDAAYVATGQTGVMVGSDIGTVIDHVPGDFMSGAVEGMIREMVEKKGKELIFVQGQASLTHLAYAPVTLGILYGSRPHCIVMVHDPERTFRPGFPEQRVLEPSEEATLVAVLSGALPTGIALNTQKVKDWKAACRRFEETSCLPTVDVMRQGADRLLDAILGKIDMNGKLRKGPGLRKAIAGLKVRGRSKGGGGK
jgi:uncharacterized NAD-dependent epimerase/dehydratase family protein